MTDAACASSSNTLLLPAARDDHRDSQRALAAASRPSDRLLRLTSDLIADIIAAHGVRGSPAGLLALSLLASENEGLQEAMRRSMEASLAAGKERPTDETVIEALPCVAVEQKLVDEGLTCAVCADEFQLNETRVNKLPCNHIFHNDCIVPWLKKQNTCPLCRAELPAAPRIMPRRQYVLRPFRSPVSLPTRPSLRSSTVASTLPTEDLASTLPTDEGERTPPAVGLPSPTRREPPNVFDYGNAERRRREQVPSYARPTGNTRRSRQAVAAAVVDEAAAAASPPRRRVTRSMTRRAGEPAAPSVGGGVDELD